MTHLPRTAAARRANLRLVRLHAAQLAALLQAVADDRVPAEALVDELSHATQQLRELRACAEKAYPTASRRRSWSAPL